MLMGIRVETGGITVDISRMDKILSINGTGPAVVLDERGY
jgi:hypothetical protein